MMGVQLAALLLAGRGAAWAGGALRGGCCAARSRGWPARLAGRRGSSRVARARAGLAPARRVRPPQRAAIDGPAPGGRHGGRRLDRLVAGRSSRRRRPRLRGHAVELGPGFHGRRGAGVQVPREPRRRRGRLHAAHGVADDQPGDPLRRARSRATTRSSAIRYLDPARRRAAAGAREARRSAPGPYALWTTRRRYVRTAEIVGELAADRTDLGARSIALLRSGLARTGPCSASRTGPRRREGCPAGRGSAGAVSAQRRPRPRRVRATVAMRRTGVAVLSASFDPGWTATVDGRSQRTLMVAPALVAATSPRAAPRRLPLPGIPRLPGTVRAVRPHAGHRRRRAGVREARKAAPRFGRRAPQPETPAPVGGLSGVQDPQIGRFPQR